jgi:uncharacterized membrane protein
MLIPFPIGFLVGSLVCDLIFLATGNPFWADVAFWSLAAGIVMALVAALFGFIDFAGDRAIRELGDAWQHFIGNLLAVALAIISFYLRLRYGHDAAIVPWGVILSIATVLLLIFTGWKGGELVFRHYVGVIDVPPRR